MLDPGEALDQPDALQGPQLTDEPVGRGAFQQGLFDVGEPLIRQSWRGAAGPAAAQSIGASGLPAAMPHADGLGRDLELRATSAWRTPAARSRRASRRPRSRCAARRRGTVGMHRSSPARQPNSNSTPKALLRSVRS
jgi:hypothetical protein